MASSKPQSYYICLLKALRETSSQSQSLVGACTKVTKLISFGPSRNSFWWSHGCSAHLCGTCINSCNKSPFPITGTFFDVKTEGQTDECTTRAEDWGGWIRRQDSASDYTSKAENQTYRRRIWSMASIERQWISHYNHPVHYWLS